MTHRLRVSATTQVEIIEDSLGVFSYMRDHLMSCTVCTDDSFCPLGSEAYDRVHEAKRRLKTVGYE